MALPSRAQSNLSTDVVKPECKLRSTGAPSLTYLVDDTPTGALTAEMMSRTAKALVFPRGQRPDVPQREEALRTGVHFLVGGDPEKPGARVGLHRRA